MLSKQSMIVVVLFPRAFCLFAVAFIHLLVHVTEKAFYFPFFSLSVLGSGDRGLGTLHLGSMCCGLRRQRQRPKRHPSSLSRESHPGR